MNDNVGASIGVIYFLFVCLSLCRYAVCVFMYAYTYVFVQCTYISKFVLFTCMYVYKLCECISVYTCKSIYMSVWLVISTLV